MEPWMKISLILSVYGVIKEFRPSEPFVTKYLNNPPMNFTIDQINVDIYPVSIYSSMILLVVMFLITDMLRYKPIIIINSLASVTVYIMLIVCRSLFEVQVLEVFYGFIIACDVAYYTYIYATVSVSHYQEVSGYTRAAYLVGRCISGITSQILVFIGFSYYFLNIFTLGGMCLSLIWALILPPVPRSIYFHRERDNGKSDNGDDTNVLEQTEVDCVTFLKRGLSRLWKDFISAYSNLYVVKWAFWWAVGTCAYYQILTYIQPLWEQVILENHITGYLTQLNGIVEAIYTILSAVVAFYCGKLKINWSRYGEVLLTVCSFIFAGILFALSELDNIWLSHAAYVLYTILFNGMITIAASEVAKCINLDSHGLVFGINMFVALVMQSLLTYFIVDYLNLDPRQQFVSYGIYYCVAGIIFGTTSLYSLCKKR
ncbi:thiamine transporter 1-like isoform X2 [Cimex lectularius]|uniref:Reduced folate carrier n=1 Tax=Cimex lectularius TaxID=79782 RepID=A0A8I6RHR0_CIMLE|nr:thiamine transporter 1-like isoform X2 [Cimex lectularius]